jgi:hypothetical protein
VSKLTEAARGQSCVRCGRNDGTIVAAHINGPLAFKLGRGMGQKPDDVFCADLCHTCHDVLDGRSFAERLDPEDHTAEWMELVLLTIQRRRREGVLK